MKDLNSIRELVKKGEPGAMKEAMDKLQEVFIKKEFDPNPIYLLESRFNKNERLNLLGILEINNYNLENNRITNSLLEFIAQIEKGDDFTNLKPLRIIISRQNIGQKRIEIEIEAFHEKHNLELKTTWFYFIAFHNGGKKPLYKKSNILNYHEELHVFNIPTKNNSFLKVEFSTSYEIWSASFKNPKLNIENLQIIPNA